ncbi:MAG: peptide ABC transporter substrate-binding protein, partial [Burkholderiales bacterium]|nr:peptide ABC transporter substrate-binding protein [Anaerolineae bacterium]
MFRRRTTLFFVFCILALTLVPLTISIVGAQDDNVDVYGRPLPEDAAPYEMQTWQNLCNSARTETSLASAVSVYQRICDQNAFDKFGDSLVQLDENLNLTPAAAESWESSEDGLTWTFHLRAGQMWNDGTPLTANDYVATYRYMAEPDHAYDFVWMWNGIIAGWDEAVAGEISTDEIGVAAPDDLTFTVTTAVPFPPLPGTMYFWPPLQAAALEEFGPDYMLDPETSVSSGPFQLVEFVPGDHILLEANPDYTGYRQPYLRQ